MRIPRFARLWREHSADATRLAYLLCGDADRARRTAARSLLRVATRFQDARDPAAVESFVRRAVVGIPTRRLTSAARSERDELWEVFLTLPRHLKAPVALVYGLELTVEQAADALQLPSNLVVTRLERAVRAVSDLQSETVTGATLAAMTRRRATDVAPAAEPPSSIARSALVGRIVAVALLLSFGGGVAGLGAKVLGSAEPLARTNPLDPDEDAFLREAVARFGLCPDTRSALAFGRGAARRAARAAVAFNDALIRRDLQTIARLAYPAQQTRRPDHWVPTSTRKNIRITHSAPATEDALVIIGCGRGVARISWEVVMHDGTSTTTEGLARYYLVRRADGWRVWGFDPSA